MYPPIVCVHCGFPIGIYYRAFCASCKNMSAGAPVGPILDALRITKICCRATIMTNANFVDYYNQRSASASASALPLVSTDTIQRSRKHK